MNNAIVAYSATEAALTNLATRYKDVIFDVTKPDGMQDAKAAYKDINSHSITLEKAREKEKAESLAYGRWVDSEAKRIADKLDALRLPIKAQIETETKRIEQEREEKVRIEAERIAAEQKALKDTEEARMAAERAEIARQQAEIARAAQESRSKIEAEERAARERIETAERLARKEREEADRQARLAQQARDEVERVKRAEEEARLKSERDKLDAERRAVEDAQRKERETEEQRQRSARMAEEARLRAIKQQEADLVDAKGMLRLFITRYSGIAEFSVVVIAIDEYFKRESASRKPTASPDGKPTA